MSAIPDKADLRSYSPMSAQLDDHCRCPHGVSAFPGDLHTAALVLEDRSLGWATVRPVLDEFEERGGAQVSDC